MMELPDRPDLAQLRRRAKELHRAAAAGQPDALRRLRALSRPPRLADAQLAIARENGFSSWPGMRAALTANAGDAVGALMAGKHGRPAVRRAVDALDFARTHGWDPGPVPLGAVFTSQTFITKDLELRPERFRLSESLTPTNGKVFLTCEAPVVAVACLGTGAPAVVTLLEQLAGLGVRSFVAVGPAPALALHLAWGECVVVDRALRDDGVSHHYAPPTRYSFADPSLTERLRIAASVRQLEPRVGSSWTVPTPYRTTEEELIAYRAEGILVTELTTAALFVVAAALGVRAASAVVTTRTLGPSRSDPPRPKSIFALIDAAVAVLRQDSGVSV